MAQADIGNLQVFKEGLQQKREKLSASIPILFEHLKSNHAEAESTKQTILALQKSIKEDTLKYITWLFKQKLGEVQASVANAQNLNQSIIAALAPEAEENAIEKVSNASIKDAIRKAKKIQNEQGYELESLNQKVQNLESFVQEASTTLMLSETEANSMADIQTFVNKSGAQQQAPTPPPANNNGQGTQSTQSAQGAQGGARRKRRTTSAKK